MNRITSQFKSTLWKSSHPTARFATCAPLCDRSSDSRQGKILSKLFGNRVSGSKKRWVENPMPSSRQSEANSPLNFTHSKNNDHGTNRRTAVLNKLFMTHITDLLATGEASQKILGKGLQITRVKVTPNFQFCNVYWMAKGGAAEVQLEEELQKCGGMLRHELSQLRLMGEVPRIHFVKDKTFANLALVETVLKTCDFGEDHKEMDPSLQVKNDLYRNLSEMIRKKSDEDEDDEESLPEMRHDVFGLDQRAVMLKILAKMKKSEQAWLQHDRGEEATVVVSEDSALEKMNKLKEKIAESEKDESFNKFLTKLSETNRLRDRRYRRADDGFYRRIDDDEDELLDDGDYIEEENDEKRK